MRPKRKRNSPGSMLAVAGAVVLVMFVVLFRNGAAGLVSGITAPLLNLRNALSASEVSNLRAELASTSALLADRDLLAAENTQLRAELGRTNNSKKLLAGVLQNPPGTPYDTLTVDAGSSLGVAVGARVWAGGLSIGEVDAVYGETSRVTLYSAPGQSYQAMLVTQKGVTIPVVVDGQGAGSMQTQIPADIKVTAGDTIVFSGVAGGLAAKVTGVSAPESESFKTIYLHVPVNFFELRYVYIEQ